MIGWVSNHLAACAQACGRLWRRPVDSFLTVSVIAVALALPLTVGLVLEELRELGAFDSEAGELSAFLTEDVEQPRAQDLATAIARWPEVERTRWISAVEGRELLSTVPGFADAFALLEQNPLPQVISVRPVRHDPAALESLQTRLDGLDQIDFVQFDLHWLVRFNAIIDAASRANWLLLILLAMVMVGVIGNTIRLDVSNRREEIEVVKILGGHDAFVRRPFLYSGGLLGLLGAAGAAGLVYAALRFVAQPLAEISFAYGGDWGPGFVVFPLLISAGVGVGIMSAWIAVAWRMRHIDLL